MSNENKCHTPPKGWECTRQPGHEGPCAAVPSKKKKPGFFRELLRKTANFVVCSTLAFLASFWVCAIVLLFFVFIATTCVCASLGVVVLIAGGGSFSQALEEFSKWVEEL